jgi:hypothetical protein
MLTKTTVHNIEAIERAAKAADVSIVERTDMGALSVIVIKFKHPEQLIKLGMFSAMSQPEVKPEPVKEVKETAKTSVEPETKKAPETEQKPEAVETSKANGKK